MPPPANNICTLASVALLGFFSVAVAYSHDDSVKMDTGMDMSDSSPRPTVSPMPAPVEPTTYFQYGENSGFLIAHIFFMTIAWVFILPICVMLSISRSRYSLPTQFVFLVVNAVGVVLITIYNASTPDFYPNNAHHMLGWILTWTMSVQVVVGVISSYSKRKDNTGFIPVSQEAIAEHQRIHDLRRMDTCRFSNDSGHGTETNTESLRSQSSSEEDHQLPGSRDEFEDNEEKQEMMHSKLDQFLARKIPGLLSSRFLGVFHFFYNAVDRIILILGFAALMTGLITYGGLFKGGKVFSGLAHFIKGGVFFWYGILTLGRWAGCFVAIGWAWNMKPSQGMADARQANQPSAEFVESFLIFFYGSTNVFLEHLNAWGKEWSAQDLEHISLTIVFFGGGLSGMLIESKRIRNLLNSTIESSFSQIQYSDDRGALEEPKSYKFSMNPIPALVVLLLGMAMSSHHQESMISTMIHAQWGTLLVGAAFARAATYVVFYLSPPTSMLPGRPPTELITAFCLMAGGMIFMASARDTVETMELHGLDAMFVFTVSIGVITFLMAWIIVVLAIKGWAVRKENRNFTYRGVA